ncbi:amidohydrolase family protein [Streptomyces sp. MNU76]|uniref:amidohydrolase family protein n=1 Tax=Streptomyces sp. MNU76 TaxID=2560026 RepID=UPI001E62274E|nr:amidohydrolase family protein [Streptomyces sp. MNU76]MCC9707057.1 amidohydrolase family protein [Streptomyces sp. MNU76]
MAIDAVERAQDELPRPGVRHRVEHCALPEDAQIKRMADLGMWAVFQPQHNWYTGDWVLDTIGESAHRYSPAGLFQAAGAPYVLSSDAPVAWPSPLEAVAAAVHRRTVLGTVLGGTDTALTVMQWLRAHTLAGAAALHRDHETGSLEPGKCADFAVLATDPTTVPPIELPGIAVRQTWIGGACVLDRSLSGQDTRG